MENQIKILKETLSKIKEIDTEIFKLSTLKRREKHLNNFTSLVKSLDQLKVDGKIWLSCFRETFGNEINVKEYFNEYDFRIGKLYDFDLKATNLSTTVKYSLEELLEIYLKEENYEICAQIRDKINEINPDKV